MTKTLSLRAVFLRAGILIAFAAAVFMLHTSSAHAWTVTTGDFKCTSSGYGSNLVVSATYAGSGSVSEITFPTTVDRELSGTTTTYNITAVGEGALGNLAEVEGIEVAVTIPEGYTDVSGSAFKNAVALKSISLPSTITSVSYSAFNGCSNLTSVSFADSTAKLSFGNQVFAGCTSLTSFVLPSNTSSMGAALLQNSGVASLSVASGCEKYIADNNMIFTPDDAGTGYVLVAYAEGLKASSLTIPSEVNGKPVTGLFRMTFQKNADLESVTIPSSVTSIGMSCFNNCTSLKKVSIEGESVAFDSSAFTGLPEGSVIEVANETVAAALEPTKSYSYTTEYYTAANTTVKVKDSSSPSAGSAAALSLKANSAKDGYAYYTVYLDSAENVSTMMLKLTFDGTKLSKDAVNDLKAAYAKVRDDNFTLLSQEWTEADDIIEAKLLLTASGVNASVSKDASAALLLLTLPVKENATGDLSMQIAAAECAGIIDGSSVKGTVEFSTSPVSIHVTSYDVNGDGSVDILDITEAQLYYQASSKDADWAASQKADVNNDGSVDIQDLIDIFLQIEF